MTLEYSEPRKSENKPHSSESALKRFVSYLFLSVAIGAVIWGRIETIDLTEGRALIDGWPYWLTCLISSIAAVGVYTYPGKVQSRKKITVFPKGTIVKFNGIPCELLEDAAYKSGTFRGS